MSRSVIKDSVEHKELLRTTSVLKLVELKLGQNSFPLPSGRFSTSDFILVVPQGCETESGMRLQAGHIHKKCILSQSSISQIKTVKFGSEEYKELLLQVGRVKLILLNSTNILSDYHSNMIFVLPAGFGVENVITTDEGKLQISRHHLPATKIAIGEVRDVHYLELYFADDSIEKYRIAANPTAQSSPLPYAPLREVTELYNKTYTQATPTPEFFVVTSSIVMQKAAEIMRRPFVWPSIEEYKNLLILEISDGHIIAPHACVEPLAGIAPELIPGAAAAADAATDDVQQVLGAAAADPDHIPE